MRRAAVMILAALLALVALSSTASAQARHRCKPTTSFDLALTANAAATCAQARAVERYENTHEALDGSFFAARLQWLGAVYSRAHGHTYMVFVSPGARIAIVWITVSRPVS